MRPAPLTSTVALLLAPAFAAASGTDVAAGAVGGGGLALRARKALTVTRDEPAVIDHAVALVRDGRFEVVGRADEVEIPSGYRIEDLGASWIMPGMIDLHSHIGDTGDINDMVLQTNEGLRVSTSVVPHEVFGALLARRAQVSAHTQVYHLALTTLTLLRGEFDLDVYIDHGEWGASRLAELAQEPGLGERCW